MSELYNDRNFLELVIKCMFRSGPVLQKAIDLQLKPEDLGGIEIYKAFIETALQIGKAPINDGLCLSVMKSVMKGRSLIGAEDMQQVVQFWEFIYDNTNDLNEEFIIKHLPELLKVRRFVSNRVNQIDSPQQVVELAGKIVADIDLRNGSDAVREFNPFEELVMVEHKETLATGFASVDIVARGLNYQEFGLILGHSGSGKTAMSTFSAIQNARRDNRKVLYLSLEEPGENICNRVYSNIFRINYTDLHKGSKFAQDDLRAAFQNMAPLDKEAIKNLKIHDLRDATPITAKYIENYLDNLYKTTGYHPDLVYIDQMDYLTTNDSYDAEWQKYGKIAFEVDDLSNHLIGGEHPFSVWLIHQASGKMTKKFTNSEISGFKGIIKPTDMALAIGRESSQDQVVSIFSLKSRHAKNFQFDYLAELEYMNFEQLNNGAADRMKIEDDDKKARRGANFKNIPGKGMTLPGEMLPAPGGGFNS